MLFNPSWQKPAEQKPLTIYSLEALIAWLETMPPAQEYNACYPAACLLGQYAAAIGAVHPSIVSLALSEDKALAEIAFGGLDNFYWTFGAALKRARAIHAKES